METTPDRLRERIRDIMIVKQTDPSRLAKQLGYGKDYIRDFLEGRKDSISVRAVAALERVVEAEPGELVSYVPEEPGDKFRADYKRSRGEGIGIPKETISIFSARRSLMEDNEMRMSSKPIDEILRPPNIHQHSSAYAILVETDFMFPAYEPGDIVFLNPDVGNRADTDVLALSFAAKESGFSERWSRCILGRLKDIDRNRSLIEIYNPSMTVELHGQEWPTIHRVVGKFAKR